MPDERRTGPDRREAVNHPAHYGGEDNPYEAIKVIEAWGLGFHDGNAVKYICRQGKKSDRIEDLKKARWYLDRLIAKLDMEKQEQGYRSGISKCVICHQTMTGPSYTTTGQSGRYAHHDCFYPPNPGAVSAPKPDRTGAPGSNGLPESAPLVPSGNESSSVSRRSRSTKRTR